MRIPQIATVRIIHVKGEKMKKLALGIVVGFIILSIIAWKGNSESGSGKYILFQGEYELHNEKVCCILKMNTETGNTWKYNWSSNTWALIKN